MDSSSHVFMTFSTILILLVSHSMAANAPSKLVQDVCKDVAESKFFTMATGFAKYDDCVGILQLDPRTASANLTSTLAEITVQLAISHARNTRHLIRNELKTHRAPLVKENLATCNSWYERVIRNYVFARQDIITKNLEADFSFYRINLVDAIMLCERVMGQIKAPPSFPKLARRNYVALKFVQIAMVQMDRLKNA